MPAFLDAETMGEWLAPRKLEKDEREHLHGLLGEVSEKIAGSLVAHPVDRAVNNVRTLDRKDSGLIVPVELGRPRGNRRLRWSSWPCVTLGSAGLAAPSACAS